MSDHEKQEPVGMKPKETSQQDFELFTQRRKREHELLAVEEGRLQWSDIMDGVKG